MPQTNRFYYNLNRHTFSVQEKNSNGDWRVNKQKYSNKFLVKDVTFEVSEAGRKRVIRDKIKNVHAYVVGVECDIKIDKSKAVELTYNPYKYTTFVVKETGQPIYEAKLVLLENKKIFAQL